MKVLSKSRGMAGGQRRNLQIGRRTNRKRQYQLESLESRTLLTYTFTYGGSLGPQVVDESGGGDSFTVENNGAGLLQWSQDNGATFSTQWGPIPADTLQANPAVALTINLGSDNSAVIDGVSTVGSTATSSASAVLAHLVVNAAAGNTSDSLVIDDTTSNLGTGTYTLHTNANPIVTGPLGDIDISAGANPIAGGVTIYGSASNNTFNVTSTYADEPVNIIAGAGTNTVNVGNGGSLAGIVVPISVTDPTGAVMLNIDDGSDTTHATATLDNLAGGSTPYELTGLGNAPISWGAGVTAVNITGGTSGGNGVTFDINNTQSITTTTITGGPNQNFFNLSNASETGGLDNLPGPVSILGGSTFSDIVTLDDSSADFNDTYTITSTTVSRIVFGGLTYDDNIGTLTLNAENTLGTNGNNTIDINSTADSVTTNVNGQGGNDTINVNGTGSSSVLNITAGLSASSTVNVVANNEPVAINFDGDIGGPDDIVNVGSTGGDGTMVGILGNIAILDPNTFLTLSFHDENDTAGHTWTLDNDDSVAPLGTGSVALDGGIGTTSYRPGDLNSPLTINGGSGGNTFIVNNTTSDGGDNGPVDTILNTGTGNDTVDVFATGTNTLDINGQDGLDTVTLGALAGVGMQDLSGTINVGNVLDFSALTLDDSEDATGQTATMTDDGTTGTVTGLSPATINYTDFDISSLTVLGGSGGNSFTVQGTLVNADFPATVTTLDKGSGGPNTVQVSATSAGSMLNLVGGGGPDTVTIGDGNQGTILGPVNVNEAAGSTNMIINLSTDALPHNLDLSSDGITGTLSDTLGNLPHNITYNVAALNSLTIDTDPLEDETLNVSFASGGNPIPISDSAGLIFNAGDPIPGVTHALNISGELPSGPFATEIHNANDQTVFPQVGQYGSIIFTESVGDAGPGAIGTQTIIDYTGLQPITDTAPATLYTFNDFGWPDQSFSATVPGTLLPGSLEFASIPTPATPLNFETTDVLNKVNVVFNTPVPVIGQPGNGVFGLVNVPTASAGLASLTFNVSTGNDNTVDFTATPAGVVTTLNGSTATDITNVTGLGVAAGTTLTLNGGNSPDILNYDAGGEIPTITAGLLPKEVLITIPGAGTVDASYYNAINIINAAAPPAPVVVTTPNINTVEGFQLVNAVVGTFSFPISAFFPAGTTLPAGLPASDFTATFNWGDGTSTAATIVQDPTDPSVYGVEGTHIYTSPGLYPITVTVSLASGVANGRSTARRSRLLYPRQPPLLRGSPRRDSGYRDGCNACRHGLPDRRDRRDGDRRGPHRHLHR